MKHAFVYKFIYKAFVAVFLLTGCASSGQRPFTHKSTYTSSFPTKNVSGKLAQIQQSVQHISSTALYRTYYMDAQNVRREQLTAGKLSETNYRNKIIDKNRAGTAVSILQNDNYTALITAQHVVSFADTLITYKKGKNIPKNTFVSSVSLKMRQRAYVINKAQLQQVRLVAENGADDLAVIAVNRDENDIYAPPLSIKIGDPKKLRLASFVYILGYPFGTPMVTRGIVSAPDYNNRGRFLTDALFNHGISGGLIVASKDNFSSFEWVGMAVTASASKRKFLVPKPSQVQKYHNLEAYTDTAYVFKKQIINYGITDVTPVSEIKLFLLQNESRLNEFGFSFTDFKE